MNTKDYFKSIQNYFWIWEEEGNVLTINGGSTIVYTEELLKYLDALSINGLPRFGVILLSIIGTNKTLDNSLVYISMLLNNIAASNFGNQLNKEFINDAFCFLKNLQELPPKMKTGDNRIILLQTILKNSHNKIGLKESTGILNSFKTRNRAKYIEQQIFDISIVKNDIAILSLLHKKFPTVQDLIDVFFENIDVEKFEDFEIDSESSIEENQNKDFIDELIHDNKTFQIGSLIKPIWAGFKIPIFNSHSSDFPLGGYSDISNKGSFDKLLISEYANDDIIFMARLANNEALYLHREMPPISDKLKRIMLIDVSIKNWGTPKILSFASSIALSLHPKSKTKNELYTLSNIHESFDHEDKYSIINAISIVHVGLDAADGFKNFFNEFDSSKEIELFFFTTEEALKTPYLINLLIEKSKQIKYIVVCKINGEINFYLNKIGNLKHLQTIQLDLKKLWNNSKKVHHESLNEKVEDLYFPILVPSTSYNNIISLNNKETFVISNSNLLKHTKIDDNYNTKGFELILKGVSNNCSNAIGQSSDGTYYFLEHNFNKKKLTITDLSTKHSLSIDLSVIKGKSNKKYLYKDNVFILFGSSTCTYTLYPNFETNQIDVLEHKYDYSISSKYETEYLKIKKINSEIHFPKQSTITKLKDLYINHKSNLVINQHEFNLLNNQQFIWLNETIDNIGKKYQKNSLRKNIGIFRDGSKVSINKLGFLTLVSSNPDIPTIYIPTCIMNQLGVATETHFAGNTFFYNNSVIGNTVKLINSGNNRIEVIKIIKKFNFESLSELKTGVDSPPYIISKNMDNEQSIKLKNELAILNAEVTIQRNSKSEQIIISNQDFHTKYIQGFINTIINYETRN